MGTFVILHWYQDAQLKKAEKASSSTALASEEPRPGPSSSSMSSQEEQTSEQPTEVQSEVQSEAPSRGSPIDLSTKKSPESTTETAATTSTTTTTSRGMDHFLFITTHVKPSTSLSVCVCLPALVR